MNVHERRRTIAELLQSAGEATFADLSARFGVSEMTIRRDIDALSDDGLARRVLGGAIAQQRMAVEPPFGTRLADAGDAKRHLARRVVDLLHDGESVIVDSGSTALAVARELAARPHRDMTIVTPSLLAAIELADAEGVTVLVPAGEARGGELSLVGSETIETLRRYNCDTFVMGVAGIDPARGVTDYHRAESEVKRAAMACAARVVVVADASKLGRTTLVTIAPIERIDVLVTDAGEHHETVAALRDAGVTVVCVPVDGSTTGRGD